MQMAKTFKKIKYLEMIKIAIFSFEWMLILKKIKVMLKQ